VIFLEPKRLYNGPFDGHYDRPVTPWSKHPMGEVPEGHFTVPLGQAMVRRAGTAATVLAYGTMVYVAKAAARRPASTPRSSTCARSAAARSRGDRRLGQEDRALRGGARGDADLGFGAELAALVQEHCFYSLEAPVARVTGWDTPYPHAQEWDYFPGPKRVGEALVDVMEA
jgi:2-oxoisovalerate dehydrogenase E1 component beta subunit